MDETFKQRWRHRLERLEQYIIDVIYDRRKGYAESILAFLLWLLSHLFNSLVQLRFLLYRQRLLRDQPLGCLVVVVGNLTVGGTGKTPVVEKFARSLNERGRRVAILSRGYKSRSEPKLRTFWRWLIHRPPPPPKVVSDGKNIRLSFEEAGDEPYMLARNLPGVAVLVDKNRVKAGEFAIKHLGADTLLLDDGFQYLPLRGQLNLLLVDSRNPFGNGHLLPRGILREPVKHIRRASYVLITKSDGNPDPALKAMLRRHKPDIDLIESSHNPKYLQRVFSDERQSLDFLRGRKAAIFSGIAVPESFEEFVRDLGARIVFNRRFLDHHRFNASEINHFIAQAKEQEADLIVTTEKDAVRLYPEWIEDAPPVYFLRLEIDILSGFADFEEAVSRICFPKNSMQATRSPFIR